METLITKQTLTETRNNVLGQKTETRRKHLEKRELIPKLASTITPTCIRVSSSTPKNHFWVTSRVFFQQTETVAR